VINIADRFVLLARLLNEADYEFVERLNTSIAKRFRRHRMGIFRKELRKIARDVGSGFRVKASRLEAAGCWRDYPSLVYVTGLTFWALARLRFACLLFSMRLPVLIDVAATTNGLAKYVTAGASSAAPSRSLG